MGLKTGEGKGASELGYQVIKSQYENELESRKKLNMKQFLQNKTHYHHRGVEGWDR